MMIFTADKSDILDKQRTSDAQESAQSAQCQTATSHTQMVKDGVGPELASGRGPHKSRHSRRHSAKGRLLGLDSRHTESDRTGRGAVALPDLMTVVAGLHEARVAFEERVKIRDLVVAPTRLPFDRDFEGCQEGTTAGQAQ
jgi:hypothetical protein